MHEIFKDISTVQTRNVIKKNEDFRQHKTLPTAEKKNGDRPGVGGATLLYSVWLTSLPPLRVQDLEDEQKRFVRLGKTCPSAFAFHHFRRPHNNYPTSPLHSIGQHAMRIRKSATRCNRSTRVQSLILKLHISNSISRVLPVVFHEFLCPTGKTTGRGPSRYRHNNSGRNITETSCIR